MPVVNGDRTVKYTLKTLAQATPETGLHSLSFSGHHAYTPRLNGKLLTYPCFLNNYFFFFFSISQHSLVTTEIILHSKPEKSK